MKRRWLLTGVTMLAGCSLLPQQPYLQRRDWPLDVRRPQPAQAAARGRILLVRSVRAAPGLDARGVQWLQKDGSIHVDFYEQWAVPPAQAVEDNLRRWLADSGLFSAVIAPGSRLNADFVLEGELNTFVADLNRGVARAGLAIVLLDQRPNPVKVLLQKTETAEVRLTGTDPPAIVEALRGALANVLQQTEADIATASR